MKDLNILTLKYFKCVPISEVVHDNTPKDVIAEINSETIKKGFVLSPEIYKTSNYEKFHKNVHDAYFRELINKIVESLGPTIKQKNQSFHKSWDKVKNASSIQLVAEQLAHYITTYGFEQLGIFDDDTVYVPYEKLDIPELEDNYPLIVIKGLTEKEIKEKCMSMLESGIALKEETINDLFTILKEVEISIEDVDRINNKEMKIKFLDDFNIKPTNPEEFLRLAIYRATGTTLIIKSPELIRRIKESNRNYDVIDMFNQLSEVHLKNLGQSFNRYKPLFLAFKNEHTNTIINKIAKYSKIYHKPIKEDLLNTITEKISRSEPISTEEFVESLKNANCFRKIRLLYALSNRITLSKVDSEVYSIRNGKTFVKEKNKNKDSNLIELLRCCNSVTSSIVEDLSKKVNNKKVYIPKGMEYVLPSSEKQFTGNIPNGSYVEIDGGLVFGVHWFNTNKSVDLDLSFIDSDGKKIGWNTSYRNEDRTIMYSGDMTNAPRPNGASELIYISHPDVLEGIVTINNYRYEEGDEVPYSTWVGAIDSTNNNHVFNQNNIKYECESKIYKKNNIIGLVESDGEKFRYYFTELNLGGGIVSSSNTYNSEARKVLLQKYKNMISLNHLLSVAGAIFEEEKENADIDLDFRSVEKDTFIDLFDKNE